MAPSPYGGRGPVLTGIVWLEAILALILVGLRLYGASVKAGQIRWDFLWVALAIVVGVISQSALHVSVYYGMGNHLAKVPLDDIFKSLHWIWISIFIGIIAVIFAKFAIIALLLEVQGPNAKKRNYCLWCLGALIAVSGVVQIFLSLFQCSPMSKLWNVLEAGTCSRRALAGDFSYFQGSIAILSDFVLALWPISIVWNLQTTFKVKVAFCALMAAGALPCIASLVRIVLLGNLARSADITWDFAPWMTWAATELWAVIILSSIPPLRPLFKRFFSKVTTTIHEVSGYGNVNYGRGTNRGTNNGTVEGDMKPGASVNLVRVGAGSRLGQEGKKGEKSQHTAHIVGASVLDPSGSEEDLVGDSGMGIVVQTEYAVESGQWDRKGSASGSWFDGDAAK